MARLLDQGVIVHALARNTSPIGDLRKSSRWPADRLLDHAVDLAIDEEVERFCTEFNSRARQLDVLVHSAGAIQIAAFEKASLEDFDRQHRINVRAPFRLTQALLPLLVAAQGQVVFVNSSAGIRASKNGAQYGATKHALRALADSLRDEVNERGVRVTSVFLGRTASGMQSLVHRAEGRSYDPAKLLQPADIASVVVNALELPRTAEVTDLWIRPFIKSY